MTIFEKPETNVKAFPGTKREPVEGLMLIPPPTNACKHLFVTFTVDVKAGKCICGNCKSEVSPFTVLEQLMREESLWNRSREEFRNQRTILAEKKRTKCQWCEKMTRIRL